MNQFNNTDIILFTLAILIIFIILFAVFCFSYWLSRKKVSVSPYSGLPLRKGADLSFAAKEKVYRMLYDMHEYDNRIFDMDKAAVCRETGRIFFNAKTWFDTLEVDWSFLTKRYPGNYVSWGSLTEQQKEAIRAVHISLEGFQSERSCPRPVPRLIEPEYIYDSPGPLYVDIETKVLLGWKEIPETNLEILIVQKPIKPS